jgi:hypothetical protein
MSLAMFSILFPFSSVGIAIGVDDAAYTIGFAVTPFAFVECPFRNPDLESIAVTLTFLPSSVVNDICVE